MTFFFLWIDSKVAVQIFRAKGQLV